MHLKDGHFQFTTINNVFAEQCRACQINGEYKSFFGCPVSAAPAESTGEFALCCFSIQGQDLDGMMNECDNPTKKSFRHGTSKFVLGKLDPPKPKAKAKTTNADLDADVGDVGWVALPDEYDELANPDETESAEQNHFLEWHPSDEDDSAKITASEINSGLIENGKTSERARSQLVVDAVVAELASKQSGPVVMTREELEEEAVLMLVRNYTHEGGALDRDIVETVAAAESKLTSGGGGGGGGALFSASEPEDDDSSLSDDEPVTRATQAPDHERDSTTRPDLAKFILEWKTNFDATVSALRDYHERTSLPLGYQDEISLVMFSPQRQDTDRDIGGDADDLPKTHQLLFVRWQDTNIRTGRPVRIDKEHRVVWAPASLFGKPIPLETFAPPRHLCLVTACGAVSRRQRGNKGAMRDKLPTTIVRLARVVGLALAYTDGELGLP